MNRRTGLYGVSTSPGEQIEPFVLYPLPPALPPLAIDAHTAERHADALTALARLAVAGGMVPSTDWFLYGFVRKEAVVTLQIGGTQATLRDVITFEATEQSDRPADVEEVCNYVAALANARAQLAGPAGLPPSIRLLCDAHRVLMRGVRGRNNLPGEIRRSQNWIGGTRLGNARFVPPPPDDLSRTLGELEAWLQADSALPPLVRIALAHAQFEIIHPFLDGNGRIGRLLIALLAEHWNLLEQPLLYVSVAFRRAHQEYCARLSAVHTDGDWEGWVRFFLECVREAADDGVHVAQALHALVARDRRRIIAHGRSTVAAIQLLELLPSNPVITVSGASALLGLTTPPTRKAIQLLESLHILREMTGKERGRLYAYDEYLQILSGDDE